MIQRGAFIAPLALQFAGVCAFGQTLTTLYEFGATSSDGEDPQAGVVFDGNGNLLGMATLGGNSNGDGTIYKLKPPDGGGTPWREVIIHRFRGPPDDGSAPESRPIIGHRGVLYGTTYLGGTENMGLAFRVIPPDAPGEPWSVRVIHSFGATSGDGRNPNASLLQSDELLHGVTQNGGSNGRGTVFELVPPSEPGGGWGERVLHSFRALPDAAFPSSELTMDADGNLYGNALQGGTDNLGAVFRLSPPIEPGGSWTETVLHSFDGAGGALPLGRLIMDETGALYGTTSGGGRGGSGTVFKLTPPAIPGDVWTQRVLYNFSGGRDGGSPHAGVTMGRSGRLYGTASNGGNGRPNPGGVVFMLQRPPQPGGQWRETVLHAFGGPDGFRPTAPLLLVQDRLYGTTAQGGEFGKGTAFSLRLP